MTFDIFTVLATSCTVVFVLGITILTFWMRDREAIWLAWWGGGFVVLSAGTAAVMAPPAPAGDALTAAGSSVVIAGFWLIWQAARIFEGGKPVFWPLLPVAALWAALLTIPALGGNPPVRVIVTSIPMAALLFLTARELWRGRERGLPSRPAATGVFVFMGVLFALRVPAAFVAPYPVGGLPVDPAWVAGFNGAVFISAIVTTVLIVSLTLERTESDMRVLARSDPLTGLLNRRALNDAFTDAMVPQNTAVIVFDIDSFKRVNDVHGHAAGDCLLQRFADVCRENVRQIDYAARLGGEEFAVILPRASGSVALMVAERIRMAFSEVQVQTADGPVSCTVSAGIEISSLHAGTPIHELIARADRELYRAKRSGRNRVCVAQRPVAA